MNVYLLAGLGADERLFEGFDLGEGYTIKALPWIHPGKSETLEDFAKLIEQNYSFEKPFILGGVSMGGMIAQELAAFLDPKALILISTARSRNEYPALFKLADSINLGHVLKKPALEAIAAIGDKFTVKSKQGRSLFYDMIKDTHPDFMEFGSRAILEWDGADYETPVIRIHGTRDRVFPISKVKKVDIIIDGGNHFMIFERSTEISSRLMNVLEKNPVLRGMKPKI